MPHVKRMIVTGKICDRLKKSDLSFIPGINLLIGPNGSGKSTIFQILSKRIKVGDTIYQDSRVTFDIDGQPKTFSFDFEKDSPRVKGRVDTGFDIASRWHSHGQSVAAIIAMVRSQEAKDHVMLMDEPEQALDLENLKLLISSLHASPATQIILVTHSPFLIMQPDFHVVEMVDGYRGQVVTAVQQLTALMT
jgi:predicted ATPase